MYRCVVDDEIVSWDEHTRVHHLENKGPKINLGVGLLANYHAEKMTTIDIGHKSDVVGLVQTSTMKENGSLTFGCDSPSSTHIWQNLWRG